MQVKEEEKERYNVRERVSLPLPLTPSMSSSSNPSLMYPPPTTAHLFINGMQTLNQIIVYLTALIASIRSLPIYSSTHSYAKEQREQLLITY